ncbi:hypothetical protein BD289DRAFT_421474 [Coniella lustricola]|uniref:Uncharacterized protein n=1 Tax=Coniella lustricola TaxID=2025994 RepID=A0A2T3ALM9_9PEZI|nr:hypothetical protein BD289DRAFT_421474 [Coniella lustricola]
MLIEYKMCETEKKTAITLYGVCCASPSPPLALGQGTVKGTKSGRIERQSTTVDPPSQRPKYYHQSTDPMQTHVLRLDARNQGPRWPQRAPHLQGPGANPALSSWRRPLPAGCRPSFPFPLLLFFSVFFSLVCTTRAERVRHNTMLLLGADLGPTVK